MIDTRHLDALPGLARLRDLCGALSLLEEVVEPRWDLRFVLHDVHWGPQQELTTLQTGGRARAFVWFTPAGVLIAGTGEDARARGASVLAELPATLAAASTEPAFDVESLSFAIWRLADDDGYRSGVPAEAEDGSGELLWLLDDDPSTYARFAREHHRKTLNQAKVGDVYARRTLSQHDVLTLNRSARALDVLSSAIGLGYQVSRKDSSRRGPMLPIPRPTFDPSGPAEASFTIVRDRNGTGLRVGNSVELHPDRARFDALYQRLVSTLVGGSPLDSSKPSTGAIVDQTPRAHRRVGRGLAFLERVLVEDPRMRIVFVTCGDGVERVMARDLAGGSVTFIFSPEQERLEHGAHGAFSPLPMESHAADLEWLLSILGGDTVAYVNDVRERVSIALDIEDVDAILSGRVDASWIAAFGEEYVAPDALAAAQDMGLFDEGAPMPMIRQGLATYDPDDAEMTVRGDGEGVRIIAGGRVRAHNPRRDVFGDALETARETLRR